MTRIRESHSFGLSGDARFMQRGALPLLLLPSALIAHRCFSFTSRHASHRQCSTCSTLRECRLNSKHLLQSPKWSLTDCARPSHSPSQIGVRVYVGGRQLVIEGHQGRSVNLHIQYLSSRHSVHRYGVGQREWSRSIYVGRTQSCWGSVGRGVTGDSP